MQSTLIDFFLPISLLGRNSLLKMNEWGI